MTQTDTGPESPAEEVGSDERLSPEALSALQANAQSFDDVMTEEERLTADAEEADDEPDEPDELEDDARP